METKEMKALKGLHKDGILMKGDDIFYWLEEIKEKGEIFMRRDKNLKISTIGALTMITNEECYGELSVVEE